MVNTLKTTSAFLSAGIEMGIIPKQDPKHLTMSIVGIHLTWFAAHYLSEKVSGAPLFTEDAINYRIAAVQRQIRHLCGSHE